MWISNECDKKLFKLTKIAKYQMTKLIHECNKSINIEWSNQFTNANKSTLQNTNNKYRMIKLIHECNKNNKYWMIKWSNQFAKANQSTFKVKIANIEWSN